MWQVRETGDDDIPAVLRVHRDAFGREAESELVARLFSADVPLISLAAEEAGAVVGHILFSPVTLVPCPHPVAGLAPMAVLPSRQRQGVGSALVEAGLAACRAQGCGGVVVLGHPEYYPRFGFRPARHWGIGCVYPGTDEAFMALELVPGAFVEASGIARYHPLFEGV